MVFLSAVRLPNPSHPGLRGNSYRLTLNMADPLLYPFIAFAAAAYPGMSLSAAVREAILLAMGTDPGRAALMAIRRAAWLQARAELGQIVGSALAAGQERFAQISANAEIELAVTDLQAGSA